MKKFILFLFIFSAVISVASAQSGADYSDVAVAESDAFFFETGFFGLQDAKDIAALTSMDFTRRTNIDWVEIEVQKGKYAWRIDKVINKIESFPNSVKIIIVLRSGYVKKGWPPLVACNKKTCPISPDGYDDWRDFLTTLFRKYSDKSDTVYWQIGNEFANPDIWGGNFDQYIDLAKIAYEVKEEVNPDIKLVATGLIIPQKMGRCYLYNECKFNPWVKNAFEFQDKLLRKENMRYFDIIDIHLFEYLRYNPSFIEDSIKGLRKKMRDEGYDKPIASLESTSTFGMKGRYDNTVLEGTLAVLNGFCNLDCYKKKYPGGSGWKDYFKWVKNTCDYDKCSGGHPDYDATVKLFEEEQAKDFVRMFVGAAEQKVSPLVHVQFADFPVTWNQPIWNYQGVVRRDPRSRKFVARKPVYYTYLLLLSKIKSFDSVWKITDGQYKFVVDGNPVFVLWSDSGKKQINLSGRISSDNVKITHIVTELDSFDQPIYPADEIVPAGSIVVDEAPVFAEEKR